MPSIFLSHSAKDKFFARNLAENLIKHGISVWIDEAELKIGDSLIQKIGSAIDNCDYVAVILSHNSIQSTWVQKELSLAMNRELSNKSPTVLPILKDHCDIPYFLRDKIYADFTNPEDFQKSFRRLLKDLGIEKLESTATSTTTTSTTTTTTTTPPPPPKIMTKDENHELEKFQDITIITVDKTRTYKPDPKADFYNIYFELSYHPPLEWCEIFEAERQFPRHTMWRRAWLEGKYIVIHCCLDEIKKYHLLDLKQDVGNSNMKYRDFLYREAIKKSKELKIYQQIDDALNDLDFN